MNCRGKDTRQKIVKDYELHPVAHVQLLAGQKKRSCTGDALTDTYYCFSYKSRHNATTGTIICGEHAAKDFLQLIKHPGLPLFNPLRSLGGGRTGGADASSSSMSCGTQMNWDPIAKQLHNAINLLVVCWSAPPGPALADIKSKLEKRADQPPFLNQIKAINTILGKDTKGRSLTLMINELAKTNSIKTYDFALLDNALMVEGITSNFT